MPMSRPWTLVRLHEEHPVHAFTCGTRPGAAEIDRYLRESAFAEQAAHLATVWIVEDTAATTREERIVGFFTLSPVSVRLSPQLLEAIRVEAPYATIGGWLLGRMGLASAHQGHGLGNLLVATAVRTARQTREETAGVLLVVDPKNVPLMEWYMALDFGFQRLSPKDTKSLRLVMKL